MLQDKVSIIVEKDTEKDRWIIRKDDAEYKLVYISFGKNTVVYNYMKDGEVHSIIVEPTHFDKMLPLEVV
jgi:hypothetical protein